MAMAAIEHPADALAYAAEHIDVPEGYRVEIIEGNIKVFPAPDTGHGVTASALYDAIHAAAPRDFLLVQNVEMTLPETGQLYIPDLLAAPRTSLVPSRPRVTADVAVLVAEITSPSNAQTDRVMKLRGYARSHVPAYLLIDREEEIASLFTDPQSGIYQQTLRAPFGGKLSLPEPFSGEIDTSEFAL